MSIDSIGDQAAQWISCQPGSSKRPSHTKARSLKARNLEGLKSGIHLNCQEGFVDFESFQFYL
jgi:hypothetical protein